MRGLVRYFVSFFVLGSLPIATKRQALRSWFEQRTFFKTRLRKTITIQKGAFKSARSKVRVLLGSALLLMEDG